MLVYLFLEVISNYLQHESNEQIQQCILLCWFVNVQLNAIEYLLEVHWLFRSTLALYFLQNAFDLNYMLLKLVPLA